MNMTICSDQTAHIAPPPTQDHESATRLEFFAEASTLQEAGVLMREAIGQVKGLSDSLVGLHPSCAEDLGLDPKQHRLIRKFRTQEDLNAYLAYLSDLDQRATTLAASKNCKTQSFAQYGHVPGFAYVTSSEKFGISLRQAQTGENGPWFVTGFAVLLHPDIVWKNLCNKGFIVSFD